MMDLKKQLSDALSAHRQWKDHLIHAIAIGASEFQPNLVRKDNQCAFGKWLRQEVPQPVQQTAGYQALVQAHANFHLETGHVLELALSGQRQEAEHAIGMGSDWRKRSAELISRLLSWRFDDSAAQPDGEPIDSATEKLKTILEARTQALSQATVIPTGEVMPVVVFSLANETYGIATASVKQVQPLRDVTPVPCTPDFVVGVINLCGSIFSVIDIRSFFNVPKQAISELTKVILVNAGDLDVGILADDVSGATSIPVADILPPLAAFSALKEEYVQGVTPNRLIILNLQALLRDERIIVHQ